MTKIITIIALVISSLVGAQTKYEENMSKALGLWGEGKTTEASALMERIAAVEKTNWLPNYYVAMINTTAGFNPANKDKVNALLDKAQRAVDEASLISPNNPELMVVQGLIYTVMIVQDPMTNGMKYSPKVMEVYTKAKMIAPENPRVVFSKADFEIGGAQWSGADVKALCKEVERSIGLFESFKSDVPFYPNWGLDRAKETLANCKK
ncbi:hypothetical protein [Flavobacterium capsici]|uniref:Uncharacterized protein n=1 Tax=Flavobacterium capsici TaxID=3075618 RepID=A0AA96JAM3_9FLAO|nr:MULTISPECIES: hypothetical protein [unclassified Flavobacterium]WNM20329.1 hypothetical protein RN608_06525 [Flavobacterium sp. PMR2A8]WNM21719.1 hypothetical protein RN605_13695 [Flavobacterium sp. PMTSA4]